MYFLNGLFKSQPIPYVSDYQIQKLSDGFIFNFAVFTDQKSCVKTVIYVPPIRAYMRVTCLNPDEGFTESKIVFYEILIMLGIKFITKTELFTKL